MTEMKDSGDAAGFLFYTSDDGSVKVAAPSLNRTSTDDGKSVEIKRAIDEYKWREEDFLLATYPKNGTHFMWEVMMMLLRGSADYIEDSKTWCMMDLLPLDRSDALFPSPRVLNTHYRLDVLPKEFRDCKTVLVIRNPKDTAVSLFHHGKAFAETVGGIYKRLSQLTFSGFVERFLSDKKVVYGTYFDYIEYMWTLKDDPNMLVIHFEDLKTDTVATVQKVNEFMGTSRSPEMVESIANAVEFSKMKKGKKDSQRNAEPMQNITKGLVNADDAILKLTEITYRKGDIGDWKNHFTVAHNEMFDEALEKWSVSKEIAFRYE